MDFMDMYEWIFNLVSVFTTFVFQSVFLQKLKFFLYC